jgi:hypothetical protein
MTTMRMMITMMQVLPLLPLRAVAPPLQGRLTGL